MPIPPAHRGSRSRSTTAIWATRSRSWWNMAGWALPPRTTQSCSTRTSICRPTCRCDVAELANASTVSVAPAPAGRPIIEIAGAAKTYRTRDGEVISLRPIDLTIAEGELFVVVGPSGCGKTTLLKMIAGLLPPSEGEIRVDGKRITKPHGGVGVVFQSAMLLPWRSVLRNVMMPVEVKNLPRDVHGKRAA